MPKSTRRTLPAPPPRWLKFRLTRDQVLTLHLLHELILGDLLHGQATEHTLWEHVAMVLTWSRAAQLMGLGEPEIAPQLDLAATLIERWRTTGRVQLVGIEHDVARIGSMVMDALAAAVDKETATVASEWSEQQLATQRAAALQAGPAVERRAADTVDVKQIVYALQRAERRLQEEADALLEASDYSAEFPAEDAERMREAIALLQRMPTTGTLTPPAPPAPLEQP